MPTRRGTKETKGKIQSMPKGGTATSKAKKPVNQTKSGATTVTPTKQQQRGTRMEGPTRATKPGKEKYTFSDTGKRVDGMTGRSTIVDNSALEKRAKGRLKANVSADKKALASKAAQTAAKKTAMKTAAKVAARAVPGVGQGLLAMDAVEALSPKVKEAQKKMVAKAKADKAAGKLPTKATKRSTTKKKIAK